MTKRKTAADDRLLAEDLYSHDARRGEVVGSLSTGGQRRQGIDVERVMSIDANALRVEPPIEPGWGRSCLGYGPFPRQNGLAMVCHVLNGHNTSQSENLHEEFRYRVLRWLEGCENFSLPVRFMQWLRHPRKQRMVRRLRIWWRCRGGGRPMPPLDENLAVGWLASCETSNPVVEPGNAFVMHATGPENGELWLTGRGSSMPAVRGVQNLPIYYLVVLRETGAAFYVASLAGANGLGAFPAMRIVGIEAFDDTAQVYAAFQQSVLGQIGFRLDTRVYGTRVAHLADYQTWCGTAHAADRLCGDGALGAAERGGSWHIAGGEALRTERGLSVNGPQPLVWLEMPAPSALVNVIVRTGLLSDQTRVSLCWRVVDASNYWAVRVDANGAEVGTMQGGRWTAYSTDSSCRLPANGRLSIQVTESGEQIAAFVDGCLVGGQRLRQSRASEGYGVGVAAASAGQSLLFTDFEAHPDHVEVPSVMSFGAPWFRQGNAVVLQDNFDGDAGGLDGHRSNVGDKLWHRIMGVGHMDLTGDGAARIRATVERPNPGRTAYVVDWDSPEFADFEIEMTPPGTARGQGHHGLSGFILWQDPDNYITINIWVKDSYGGASISCFFQLDGFEDLYDAIWSNVGSRVLWGKTMRLRVVFDGARYLVMIDDEPVLFRALSDVYAGQPNMQVNKLGLLANWEWGDDTGTVFHQVIGKTDNAMSQPIE